MSFYLMVLFFLAQYAFIRFDTACLAAADIFRRRRLGVAVVGCFAPMMLATR